MVSTWIWQTASIGTAARSCLLAVVEGFNRIGTQSWYRGAVLKMVWKRLMRAQFSIRMWFAAVIVICGILAAPYSIQRAICAFVILIAPIIIVTACEDSPRWVPRA